MKDLVLKRWFLLVLLSGVGLVWFYPQGLRPCSERVNLRAVVAVALFLIAWGLESRSLVSSLLRPAPALWATLISYTVLPGLGWSAGWLLPEADLRIGLLIIASVPCTLAAAVIWTRMAGGSEATALLTVLLTTALSWLATTAWLVLGTGTEVALDTVSMMWGLVLVLILPVGLGQLSRLLGPFVRTATRYKRVLGVVSQLLIISVILKAVVDAKIQLGEESSSLTIKPLASAAALCVAIHLAALAGGWWTSRLLRFERPNQIAVAFSCSQKTLPVALYLFDTYFKKSHPLAVVPIVLYHVGQLVVDTFIADALAKRSQQPAAASKLEQPQSDLIS